MGTASSPAPTYSYFQFRPDGSTNLSGSQQWTLTLLMEKDSARTVLPSNFVSIVLDPLTGDAYGALLIVKTAAFLLLIVLSAVHRSRAHGDLVDGGQPFWRIVGVELFVMALALGLSIALSQTI